MTGQKRRRVVTSLGDHGSGCDGALDLARQRIAELEEAHERLRGSLRRSLEGWHQNCGEIRRPHMHRGVDCDEEHPCDCGGWEARDEARALAWPDGPIAKRRAALELEEEVARLRLLDTKFKSLVGNVEGWRAGHGDMPPPDGQEVANSLMSHIEAISAALAPEGSPTLPEALICAIMPPQDKEAPHAAEDTDPHQDTDPY